MMNPSWKAFILLIALACFASAGFAQKDDPQQTQAKQAQAKGTVIRNKEVKLPGEDTTHTVVLLRTTDGRYVAVDLGLTEKVKDAGVQQGSKLEVSGRTARVSDRPVLFADELIIAGETRKIDREHEQERWAKFQPPGEVKETIKRDDRWEESGKQRKLQGQVVNSKEVEVKGTGDKHRVVLLKTKQGRYVLGDLGPAEQLQDLEIEQGDMLEVQGSLMRVGDRLMLRVEQVGTGGDTVQIQQPERQTKKKS